MTALRNPGITSRADIADRLQAALGGTMTFTLALRNLTKDRVRLAVTLTGVVFAVVLITLQLGLFFGFMKTITDVVNHVHADIWIGQRGVPNFEEANLIDERWMHRARGTPGVADVEKLITRFSTWKRPDGGEESVVVIGVDLDSGTLLPWNIVRGGIDALHETDTVAVDRLFLSKLGIAEEGASVEINGYRARVAAITDGIRSFTTAPYVFTSFENARKYANVGERQTSYLLAHLENGVDPVAVRDQLRSRLPHVDVYLANEFRSRHLRAWMLDTGAGSAVLTAAVLGLLVGMVVVAQTLYASTIEHLNEYVTLRAMGASNTFLYRIIVLQALLAAVAGYALGMLVSLVIEAASRRAATAIVIHAPLMLSMLGITLLMCVTAALTSIRKVTRIEPALVFKA